MPIRPLSQSSFFDPEFVAPGLLREGSTAWLLARQRSTLFPAWLLSGWRGGGRGRNAWPAAVLMTLVVLRWTEEGMSRLGSLKRARTDAEWRAAMGLAMNTAVPSERTLRDFERFLRGRHPDFDVPRYLLLHENIVRQCAEAMDLKQTAVWATDSTPMWCYGAVLDTVRLLGDGLRELGRRWARATRSTLADVAAEWEMPLLLGKSTKGALAVDWRNSTARHDAVSELATTVLRVAGLVRDGVGLLRRSLRKPVLRLCRRLLRVVRDDLETDEQGRLVIAERVAQDRLVSLTDPQARHGRKSKSHTFKGFKLHVLGDMVSGVIASVSVTPGNKHDSSVTHRLVRRAKALFADIDCVLGDTAYGGMELRKVVQSTLGIRLLAPPQPISTRGDRLSKADFEVDFARGTVTCPGDVVTTSRDGTTFAWSRSACGSCPLAERCLGPKTKSRVIHLHPQEQELRQVREDWKRPETRAAYRTRTQCERLVHRMTRHGGRRARAWGLGYAHFQAHAIATACNLALLAKALATDHQLLAAA